MRAEPVVVFDGQSLNYSPISGPPLLPKMVADLLPDGSAYCVVAIGGTTYDSRATSIASRTLPLLRNGAPSIVVDLGGNSDLGTQSLTAAQLVTRVEAYAASVRTSGATHVVETTVIPAHAALYDAAEDAQRLAYNGLLLDGLAGVDAVADIAAIPDLADPSDTDWYSDGVHPTAAGCALAAGLIFDAIMEALSA